MIPRLEVERIKYTATLITLGRIIGALLLLLIKPLSLLFFVIYTLCGLSDIADGYIARKTKTTSRHGEALDSIADLIFIAIMLFIFIPFLAWQQWMLYWICIIALIRFFSLGIGFAKYHTLPFLHTYTNKLTGIALFCFPFLYRIAGLTVTALVVCFFACVSALEELIIIIYSKKLNRNITSIFSIKHDHRAH